MARAVLTPLSEYLSTHYRPDREYVDGVVLERNLGTYDHSRSQAKFTAYLFNREKKYGIRVVPEQRVQVRSTRFRVPDVCAVLATEPVEQIFARPPFLCIEILSPEDRLQEMHQRVGDFLAFGVPYVFIVDPRERRAWRSTAEGLLEIQDGVLRTENPAIEIPLAAVFE